MKTLIRLGGCPGSLGAHVIFWFGGAAAQMCFKLFQVAVALLATLLPLLLLASTLDTSAILLWGLPCLVSLIRAVL